MRYQEALDYLYRQLPMFQRQGKKAFKKDLSNTIALCKALDNPQDFFSTIHIAGTNGKGSTTHMIAAALQANGFKVGMYTSPHYKDFRERIRINGRMISKRDVVSFVNSSESLIADIQPSFFELTVSMAFDYFRNQEVDIAVVETGLGGRLDSTNIVKPLLSVITNIGFDHQDLLGNTLMDIAGEKAGIIKPDTPVVIGSQQDDIYTVFEEKATLGKSEIINAWEEVLIDITQQSIFSTQLKYQITKSDQSGEIKLLNGAPYNGLNCRTVLAVLNKMIDMGQYDLNWDNLLVGLKSFDSMTNYQGRWQIISEEPLTLIDAAHNEDGIRSLFQALDLDQYDQVHIVFGMVNDKSRGEILSLLPSTAKYYFCKPNVPRGLEAKVLFEEASDYNLTGKYYSSVRKAMSAAKLSANSTNDLIVGCGSSFVVAELV